MAKNSHTIKVTGATPFMIPSTDFMISPLASDAALYIDKLSDGGTIDPVDIKKVGDIKANEYTKVQGAIPYIRYHINTTGDFFILYEDE